MSDDPFGQIQEAARRRAAEARAMEQLSHARARLVLRRDAPSAFFASLAMRLKPGVSWKIDTAATDGRELLVNPEWFGGLTNKEQVAIVAHEVMHPAMQHHTRRGARDLRRWNVAADAAINPILRDAGFILPEGGLFPGEGPLQDLPPGLSAEEYYRLLPEGQEGQGGAGRDESADPGGCGQVLDAGDPSERANSEADWKAAVAAAAEAAKGKGSLPGGLQRIVDEVVQPTVDWRHVLREFCRVASKDDYSWVHPNRRFVAEGVYLPGMYSESVGNIVVAVDTSGSIDDEILKSFSGELNGILETSCGTITVVYCDSEVQKVEEFSSEEGGIRLKATGGGGTSHIPVWEWLEGQAECPACVVCLTDGGTEWGNDPGVPVLWCLTEEIDPPFGKKVLMKGV